MGLCIGVMCIICSGPILAQTEGPCDELEYEAAASDDPEQIEHEGTRGMFFPMAGARFILCQINELSLRRQEIMILEREQEALVLQVTLTERQNNLLEEARERVVSVLEHTERQLDEAQARSEAWYRHPALWLSVGIVVTVGLFIGASYLIDNLDFDTD